MGLAVLQVGHEAEACAFSNYRELTTPSKQEFNIFFLSSLLLRSSGPLSGHRDIDSHPNSYYIY